MDVKRILTALLGLPAVILIIIFGNTTVVDVIFAIISVIAIREYFGAFEKSKIAKPIKWIGYLISLSVAILRLFHTKSSLIEVETDMINMMFCLVIFAVFIVFFHILNSGMKTSIVDGAVTIFGILYIPVLIMFLPIIYGQKNGNILLLYVIICGWVTDIFAYLAGKMLNTKKHKFSKISPNKSIEGCVAGAMRCNDSITHIYSNLQYIFLY